MAYSLVASVGILAGVTDGIPAGIADGILSDVIIAYWLV